MVNFLQGLRLNYFNWQIQFYKSIFYSDEGIPNMTNKHRLMPFKFSTYMRLPRDLYLRLKVSLPFKLLVACLQLSIRKNI